MRIVLDTNVLVSGTAVDAGFPRRVILKWRSGRVTLLMSAFQRAELLDVMTRPKIASVFHLNQEHIDDLLHAIDRQAEFVAPGASPIPVRDPKDDAILALAYTGGASHLITGDRDLLVLDGDQRLGMLRILTPRMFCEDVLS